MSIIIPLIIGVLVGVGAGYGFFRYVLKKKYLRMIDTANHEAEVIKEKKLLEVKEKFLNKRPSLKKRCSSVTSASYRSRTNSNSARLA